MKSIASILFCSLSRLVSAAEEAPEKFTVTWGTNIEGAEDGNKDIVAEFDRNLAPIGVDRMWALVNDKFYDEAAFFRVIPEFLVQFGIAATPDKNLAYEAIGDDPANEVSNSVGSISYGHAHDANSRTTQIFVNTGENSHLDAENYVVIGKIVKGMDLLTKHIINPNDIYPTDDGEGVNQAHYWEGGNEWLLQHYPNINLITSTSVSEGAAEDGL